MSKPQKPAKSSLEEMRKKMTKVLQQNREALQKSINSRTQQYLAK